MLQVCYKLQWTSKKACATMELGRSRAHATWQMPWRWTGERPNSVSKWGKTRPTGCRAAGPGCRFRGWGEIKVGWWCNLEFQQSFKPWFIAMVGKIGFQWDTISASNKENTAVCERYLQEGNIVHTPFALQDVHWLQARFLPGIGQASILNLTEQPKIKNAIYFTWFKWI